MTDWENVWKTANDVLQRPQVLFPSHIFDILHFCGLLLPKVHIQSELTQQTASKNICTISLYYPLFHSYIIAHKSREDSNLRGQLIFLYEYHLLLTVIHMKTVLY